ncbi:S26 family signal peptidase [soil metagenome]
MTRVFALGTTLVGALLMWAPVDLPTPTLLVWNASASAPIGLYRVDPFAAPRIGDRVVVDPPAPVASFLAARGYLPRGVPLIKTVAALPPSQVCRDGLAISINGRVLASARPEDRRGRRLPVWFGCRTLAAGEVFLLTADVPDSLDGRYFGPTSVTSIRGVAFPIALRRPGS